MEHKEHTEPPISPYFMGTKVGYLHSCGCVLDADTDAVIKTNVKVLEGKPKKSYRSGD